MKRLLVSLADLASVCAGCAGPVRGEDVSADVIASLAGDWLLAPEDGRAGCHIELGKEPVIGGYAITLAEACAKNLPDVADAAAWHLGEGGLAFADATRKTIVTFAEGEDATYATEAEPGKRLLLTKAPEGVNATPNARAVFGSWTVTGPGGKTICSVTLAEEPPPGGQESYALALAEGCHARLVKLKLASWRIEGMRLMLYGSDGESLGFLPAANGDFTEDQPANGKPMRLTRP